MQEQFAASVRRAATSDRRCPAQPNFLGGTNSARHRGRACDPCALRTANDDSFG